MAMCTDGFKNWLGKKLTELKTDENIFGIYIQGILDGDETEEEKADALQGILTEIIENENDITKACNEIMEMWLKHKPKETSPEQVRRSEDVDAKLVKLLESQALTSTKQKRYTEEEKKIREAILSQYSQMTDDEDEAAVNCSGDHKENSLEKNTNALAVVQAEKERREQARLESQRKKDKDKEDREKQKQLREEKKEKRKTQKGERRR